MFHLEVVLMRVRSWRLEAVMEVATVWWWDLAFEEVGVVEEG